MYFYAMKFVTAILLFLLISNDTLLAQVAKESIVSDVVLYEKRVQFNNYLQQQTIDANFNKPLDSTTENNYREACWAIAQFMFQSPIIEKGFTKLFNQYASLENSTKRSFLEAVYAAYPTDYITQIKKLVSIETVPKLMAMQCLYFYNNNTDTETVNWLTSQIKQGFSNYETIDVLQQTLLYINGYSKLKKLPLPSINDLIKNQKNLGVPIIYSFQKWNRDYVGLAIIQAADGSFVKDSVGKLITIQQLARSASNMPFFITNGSTPQGIFSIQGTDISNNKFIGPTPNIQLQMPFENDSTFYHNRYDSSTDKLENYLKLLPLSWQNYLPMQESFMAGKVGRSEIIAHGTTIDPDYFKGKPFYPLTPTLGCLCAKEIWNIFNGKLAESDQYNLYKNFLKTNETKGYLIVINIDDENTNVKPSQVEKLIQTTLQ